MAAGKQCFLHFRPKISLATLMLNNTPHHHHHQRESLMIVRLGRLSVLWKIKTALLYFYLRPLPIDCTERVRCLIPVSLDRFLNEIPDFMNLDKSESR